MQDAPVHCRFCGAGPFPGMNLRQCDLCDALVCERCGGVRLDQEMGDLVCWLCFKAINSPIPFPQVVSQQPRAGA